MEDKLAQYILSHIDAEPELLKRIDREAHVRLLRTNMVSGHLQGRFLKMVAQMIRPRRVLEIGTYVGYSALCLAEGIDREAELHTIEIDDELEDCIRQNFSRSPLGGRITLHIGDAGSIVPAFADDSFDLAYIDGDKKYYRDYFELTLPKIRRGGFLIADNTLWYGKVLDEAPHSDRSTRSIQAFNEQLANDDRVEKVIVPLRDGLTLIRKK